MAENGERAKLEGSIAGQSFSLATKDIIPVLLILAGLVGGYLVWVQLDKRLETAGDIIVKRLDALHEHHAKLHEMLSKGREYTHEEIERVLKALAVVNWNVTHSPDQQLPLGINGLTTPKPPSP